MKSGALRRDPEQTRAWLEKHRRSFAGRGAAPKPHSAPKRGAGPKTYPIPAETRRAARARSGGRCVVCVYWGHEGHGGGKAAHLHHVFPKQRAKWPELYAVKDNLVGLCFQHHQDAHGATGLPLLALPECVFRLAADVSQAAVDYLLRTYARPESGGPRHDGRRTDGE